MGQDWKQAEGTWIFLWSANEREVTMLMSCLHDIENTISCHLVLHEGARHGTSCIFHELIWAHVEESPFLRVPLCQQRQIVTDRKLHHTVHTALTTILQYDPGRHTTCPLYEVPLDTLDITVLWVWFTWVVRLVQLFMSYCLESKVYYHTITIIHLQ